MQYLSLNQSCNAQILEVQPKPKASHFGIKFIVCTIILDLLNGEEKKLCENFTMVKSTCTLGLISEVTSSTRHWFGRWFCTSHWF